jgi:ABC-2 type transport system ATP-binding protein
MIAVQNLRKDYAVHKRPPGALAALRSVLHREYETVRAVDDVSFEVAPGERVGLLGSNGAGKTTTLKVLSGLVHATSGTVRVAGHDPRRRERELLERISLVLGQRQRLLWDLPASETFELHRVVYGISRADFTATMGELNDLLELGDLPSRPTRELSLGERMKCELAAALVHRPKVLFLDEPTIGLDVGMQLAVRAFVQRYSEQYGATLLLTSHYMDDVVALCPRVIVLDQGAVAYDGPLEALARRVRPEKRVILRLSREVLPGDLTALGVVVRHAPLEVVLDVDPVRIQATLTQALAALPIRDLTVEDPPLEEVMAEIFAGQRDARRKALP